MDGWLSDRRFAVGLLLLSGCGGTTREGTIARDETLRGRVIDDFSQPFAEVDVIVGDEVTVTDEQGRFTVEGVGERYDVVLRCYDNVYSYQGMSRREPVFKLDLVAPDTENRYAPITVDYPASGSGVETTLVTVVEGEADVYSSRGDSPEQRKYSVMWMGDESLDVVLYAFQYEVGSRGEPTRYLGYDELRAPLRSGMPFSWSVSFRPMAFETAPIRASVALPDDYEIWSVRLAMKATASALNSSFLDASLEGPDVTLLVPRVPGATFDLTVLTAGGGSSSGRTARTLTPSSTPAKVMVEPGPTELDPPRDATGIGPDTRFTWVNGTDGIAFAHILPEGDHLHFYVATANSEFRLPDLSLLGEVLPSASTYQWAVFVTTAASLDDLAAHRTEGPRPMASTYAYSAYRFFTTR